MTRSGLTNPFRFVAILAVLAVMTPALGLAMTVEERKQLDHSKYHVTDTHAGYFDVAARRAALKATADPMLLREIADLRALDLCPASVRLPVPSGTAAIPAFYEDRDGWLKASLPFRDFEHTASKLAARQFVMPEGGAGPCLMDMLDRFAAAGAFTDVDFKVSGLQTWFQTESSLFAAALAYSVVRDDMTDRTDQKARIERWLVAAATSHLRYEGAKNGTCCNNHFYRRAVYAASIGILTGNDALFRVGISAVYSALADSGPEGALRLEMKRKQFAAKYQVYATMYLVFIAEMAGRQGYDLYAIDDHGRKLSGVVDFALASLLQPQSAADAARTPNQDDTHLADPQYYGWLELLTRNPRWSDAANALLAAQRPTYNRSLGGDTTLYFGPFER